MNIGLKIKNLRISKGLSGRQLAIKANISSSFISDVEKNLSSPTIDKLSQICAALNISLSDFFCEEENENIFLTKDLKALIKASKHLNISQIEKLIEFIKVI